MGAGGDRGQGSGWGGEGGGEGENLGQEEEGGVWAWPVNTHLFHPRVFLQATSEKGGDFSPPAGGNISSLAPKRF